MTATTSAATPRATGERFGARNWITPADEVEDAFFPYPSDLVDAVHEHILPLKGYTPRRDCSNADLLRRSREGI